MVGKCGSTTGLSTFTGISLITGCVHTENMLTYRHSHIVQQWPPPPTYLAHTQTPLVQTYPVISGPSVMSPTSPPNSVPQQRCWPTPPPPGGCVPLLPLLLLLLLLLSSSNRGRLLACSTCCCGDCDCCRPSRRIRWAGEKASRYVLQTRAVRSGT